MQVPLRDVLLPSEGPLAVGGLVLRQLALLACSGAACLLGAAALDARRFRHAREHVAVAGARPGAGRARLGTARARLGTVPARAARGESGACAR